MLNSRYMMLAAGAALLVASPAFAQSAPPASAPAAPAPSSTAASASARTYAQIVDPLTIKNDVNLSFGTLVKTPALTTTAVIVTLDGSDTVSCPAALLCSGAPTSAKFTVTGTDGQTVFLKTVATTMTSGSNTLTFTPSAQPSIVGAAAGASFTFGGSIPVSSNTVSGIYIGDVTVTADYN